MISMEKYQPVVCDFSKQGIAFVLEAYPPHFMSHKLAVFCADYYIGPGTNLAQQVPTGVTRVRLNRIWTYDNLTLKVYKLPPQRFWHQIISQLGDHP